MCVVVVVLVCGLSKHVCVFVCGSLCDVVWYVVCMVLCVLFLCLCGFCVIECAMVYGVLPLTVCARVDLCDFIRVVYLMRVRDCVCVFWRVLVFYVCCIVCCRLCFCCCCVCVRLFECVCVVCELLCDVVWFGCC